MDGTGEKTVKIIDHRIKDAILQYPTVDLILKLFPDAKMRGRLSMCNPLRGEKHPSLSFICDSHGISRWKDFAEDTTGDNIDFFRKVHPEYDYVTAVDNLAWLLFGCSALQEPGLSKGPVFNGRISKPVRKIAKAVTGQAPAIKILMSAPLLESDLSLLDYCTSRGISPALASRYLDSVLFRNDNKAGRFLLDEGGRMVLDASGNPMKNSGESFVLGMRNDIGAWSLRGVDSPKVKGFKGCDRSAVTTILADGSRPESVVSYLGPQNPAVSDVIYDSEKGFLFVNKEIGAGFSGIRADISDAASAFLRRMTGRGLYGREMECTLGVLNSLSCVKSPLVCVVEGMFDALSFIQLYHPSDNPYAPGMDMVVLNSTSNYSWCVPFLAAHDEVHSFLDNDVKSKRGAQTYTKLVTELDSFSKTLGRSVFVADDSEAIAPSKDLNEYLKSRLMIEGKESFKSNGHHR